MKSYQTITNKHKTIFMRRMMQSYPALLLIMIAVFFVAPGCTRTNNECRTCTARNTANIITASTTACSAEAETQFRNEHTGMSVKCE